MMFVEHEWIMVGEPPATGNIDQMEEEVEAS